MFRSIQLSTNQMSKRLSNATWVLGAEPSRTLKRQLTWTTGREKMHQPKGGKIGPQLPSKIIGGRN